GGSALRPSGDGPGTAGNERPRAGSATVGGSPGSLRALHLGLQQRPGPPAGDREGAASLPGEAVRSRGAGARPAKRAGEVTRGLRHQCTGASAAKGRSNAAETKAREHPRTRLASTASPIATLSASRSLTFVR